MSAAASAHALQLLGLAAAVVAGVVAARTGKLPLAMALGVAAALALRTIA